MFALCSHAIHRDNGQLTRVQINFNQKLSSCRITAENTFADLKQRFRQLYHFKLCNIVRMVQVIYACCILHNIENANDMDIFEHWIRICIIGWCISWSSVGTICIIGIWTGRTCTRQYWTNCKRWNLLAINNSIVIISMYCYQYDILTFVTFNSYLKFMVQ